MGRRAALLPVCLGTFRDAGDIVDLDQMVSRLAALEWKAQMKNRRIEGSVARKMVMIDFSRFYSKTPNLVKTSKKMCLAPILAGGTLGVTHLSQGHYTAALLSVSTGAAMSLILLASIAVASPLLGILSKRKQR